MTHPVLASALALSEAVLAAAEAADFKSVERLDAERIKLLQSFRREASLIDTDDRVMLQHIAQLNDRSLGLVEHQRRGKGREMDMAALGRRAVAAYSGVRLRR